MSRYGRKADGKRRGRPDFSKTPVILCRYSRIPSVICLVLGSVIMLLSIWDEEVYLYVGGACVLVGLLFLIPVFTFRVTWERDMLIWRNVFGVTRRYALSEVQSYRTNMHYTRFYFASGKSFRVSSDHYDGNVMDEFLRRVRAVGCRKRKGVSDSRLFWGNCSRPYQTLLYFFLFFIGSVGCALIAAVMIAEQEIPIGIFLGVLSLGLLAYLAFGVLSFRFPKKFSRLYESIEKDPNLWDKY